MDESLNINLIEENIKLEKENKELKSDKIDLINENEKLVEQKIYLENTLNNTLDALYVDKNHKCLFSDNNECAYYHTIEAIIKSSIIKLNDLSNSINDVNIKTKINEIIENLMFLDDKY